MSMPILATKLYIPPSRPNIVDRPRLIERLDEGLRLGRKLTLISASAGFGKTTLVSEWANQISNTQSPIPNIQSPKIAWLSLDEGDNDPTRFWAYLVAALQTIEANIGKGVLGILQSPQPPPTESMLTVLLNEIAAIPDNFVLVLDDYHLIDARPVDHALTFLLEHQPPKLHLVIATREDPPIPLARLRARGQLTELRAADLRFTPAEAAEFLNRVMGLDLSAKEVAALETRTEGWIAGLQLAALSMQGQDAASFIKSFSGSHHFVLDYLLEEVLHQQSASVQTFLLRTSILDRLCGPLCDAILRDSAVSGQETLEYLEQANLFIVPLDDERRWYRYHRLFAELLRQRLQQSPSPTSPPLGEPALSLSKGTEGGSVAELHIRASQWYEENGLEVEAFHHATAAHDVARAERLIEGKEIPLHFRGAVLPVLHWLESLPTPVLDAWPSLWTTYASVLLATSQTSAVEQKLQAAEKALEDAEVNAKTRDLVGRIAATRATLAVGRHQIETTIAQSRRALEFLHPNNLAFRTFTIWKLGYAYHLQGDRAAAGQAYTEAISISQASGNIITAIIATIGLGNLQEIENQLHLAAQTYRRALQLIGDPPLPFASEAYLGLARICYQWNDLDAALQHGQQSLQLARRIESTDTFAACGAFLARLKLAQGDVAGATAIWAEADQFMRRRNFVYRMPEVAATQVLILLHQGDLAGAAHLAQTHELFISRARVHLAQGDPAAALAVLEPLCQQMETKDWQDDVLKVMILQAVAWYAHGEKDRALRRLGDALALAEPGGFIRLFVDEGLPMAQLLSAAAAHGMMPDYVGKLMAVFEAEEHKGEDKSYLSPAPPAQPLVEPLSPRELEVLQLVAQGLSNREIGERLFIALSTVKGHNRNIYGKLGVQRRTEAVARARELGLL